MVKEKLGDHEDKSIQDLSTTKLMRKVFNIKQPILCWNNLETLTEKNEYEGYTHIFAGAMQGIRNPKAHDVFSQDPIRSLQMIGLASNAS